MNRRRVLLLAEDCNPEWPSLPIVGYKYAVALSRLADVTLVTHVRNRENIENAGEIAHKTRYIDNEWIARPMYRLASFLRGGTEVAWSTNQIMAYLPYLEFERRAWATFKQNLINDEFDVVHRITPMSPTLPSLIAHKLRVPFVIGPLNGNLDWPPQFTEELRREKEGLRKFRGLFKKVPYTRSTYESASRVLAAFDHTIAEMRTLVGEEKIVPFPEVGIDPQIFHADRPSEAFSHDRPKRFLFVGRLVPYKVPEAVVRAFIGSKMLAHHQLDIIGDGPERQRLESIAKSAGPVDRIRFLGKQTQSDVAQAFRSSDAFVFPSIRELGAGVVVEAMASGALCIVTHYGAPGELVGENRGIRVPLGDLQALEVGFREAMERAVNLAPNEARAMTVAARQYAEQHFTWDRKAQSTLAVYENILAEEP